jgi:hypothetical protein
VHAYTFRVQVASPKVASPKIARLGLGLRLGWGLGLDPMNGGLWEWRILRVADPIPGATIWAEAGVGVEIRTRVEVEVRG